MSERRDGGERRPPQTGTWAHKRIDSNTGDDSDYQGGLSRPKRGLELGFNPQDLRS